MDITIFADINADNLTHAPATQQPQVGAVLELSESALACIGGGIGDVVAI
jgi:hypothetical protein